MTRILALTILLSLTAPAHADLAGHMLARVGQGMPKGCPPRLWCACSLNKALVANGYKSTGSNRAIDAARYGARAHGFKRNNIIVFRHHNGFATGNTKACPAGKVQIVSGNHGNRYGVGCYSIKRIVAIRKAVK